MSQRDRQKDESRRRIVGSAVGVLRHRGLADASVAEVMAGAGLTVGGFYAHFPSKRELTEAAVRQGMGDRRRQFLDRLGGEHDWRRRLRSALTAYLTEQHRDDIGGRCPMPMAALDAARGATAATVFAEETATMAETFRTGGDDNAPPAPRDAALGTLALMVGGMILADATSGTPLSGAVLESASRFGAAALESLESRESPERAR